MTDTSLHTLTLAELKAGLEAGDFSAVDVTTALLERIAEHNADLNAVITVTGDQALAAAKAADERRATGAARPLDGLPVVHKDIFCTRGVKTTCGSRMLEEFISPYDATVVDRLETAGMIMLGKSNMDEFAMGSSNETSYFGAVKNPWDQERAYRADRPPAPPLPSRRPRTRRNRNGHGRFDSPARGVLTA
jgi:aspartyl-tRNA(Asn)/glutamyl-tRNA(Gln) amidotransferase subunit A